MTSPGDEKRELFEQFKALHVQSQSEEGTGNPGLDTLLRTVEPSFADLILNLAVPHWFNEDVVASIVETDSPEHAFKLLEEILSLSFIRSHHQGYAYHDVARDSLRQYLACTDPDSFRDSSRRFADAFTQREHQNNEEEFIWERTYMALAFDEVSGLESLDSLIKAARRDRRFTVFETLLQMAGEQSMLISAKGNTQINYYRALLAFDLRHWEEADKQFRSLNTDELHNSLAGHSQLYRGMSLEVKGLPNEAAQIYEKWLKQLCDSDEHDGLAARLYERLAQAYLSQGNLKKAESYAKRSIAINQMSGDRVGEAINFETLGRIYNKFRDLTRARRAFEKSIEMLDRAGRDFDKAQVFSDLAMLYSSFAKREDAERYYKEALEVKVEAGDNYGLAFIYSNMGKTSLQSRVPENALRYFHSSLEIFQQFKDRLNSAKVLRGIALTYEYCGDFESAIEYMQQAITALPAQSRWESAYLKELSRLEKDLQRSKRPARRRTVKILGIIGLIILVLFFVLLLILLVLIDFLT